MFTGYYEPVLKGSLQRSEDFPYPIYRKPDDWMQVDLGLFRSEWESKRIVGMLGRNSGHTSPQSVHFIADSKKYGPVGLFSVVNISWRNRTCNIDSYLAPNRRNGVYALVSFRRVLDYCQPASYVTKAKGAGPRELVGPIAFMLSTFLRRRSRGMPTFPPMPPPTPRQ